MGRALEYSKVHSVTHEEYDEKSDDLGALFVGTFKIPDAIAEVAVAASGDKAQKIGEFQIPVKNLVENPDHGERDEGVHYTDDIVFDKV